VIIFSEVQIEDAYIVSGLTGERKAMQVETRNETLAISEINAVPPGAELVFTVSLLNAMAGGMPETDSMPNGAD
jgi:hypothetical protein